MDTPQCNYDHGHIEPYTLSYIPRRNSLSLETVEAKLVRDGHHCPSYRGECWEYYWVASWADAVFSRPSILGAYDPLQQPTLLRGCKESETGTGRISYEAGSRCA